MVFRLQRMPGRCGVAGGGWWWWCGVGGVGGVGGVVSRVWGLVMVVATRGGGAADRLEGKTLKIGSVTGSRWVL